MFQHHIKFKWTILICITMTMTLNAKSIVDQTGDEKFNTLKTMTEKRINRASLVTKSGKIKNVVSFCMPFGKLAIYLDYDGQGKEVNSPQYMKDYAQNSIVQCRGKLYTTALINHLNQEEEKSCDSLKKVLNFDSLIKDNLKKSGDSALWKEYHTKYTSTCKS